eukprot:TRINITY_DN13063_c0_g1_i1.p1 TRINITY_DN13063_c0_g1~~TRINITY_DN13063_c0_g1_i1.p1  ORF type:complete len:560 (+),score=114.64 TRINITY_DN13063_c0_g1_i1:195-1874(+)
MTIDEVIENVVPDILFTLKEGRSKEVKVALYGNYPDFFAWVVNHTDDEKIILSVIDIVKNGLTDHSNKVQTAALSCLVSITINQQLPLFHDYHLNTISELFNSEDFKEGKIIVIKMISKMLEYFQHYIDIKLFLPYFTESSSSLSSETRKVVLKNLEKISGFVAPDLKKILTILQELSDDPIWEIRQSVTKNLYKFSLLVSVEEKKEILFPILQKSLEDKSRWVRTAALKQIGPLLSTCTLDDVDAEILSLFKDLAIEETEAILGNGDIAFFCAYNFPAVLSTLGKDEWIDLRETYLLLAEHFKPAVRESLSHSMHIISDIIGPVFTEADILPVLDVFLKDVPSVRFGALQNLGQVISHIKSVDIKKKYINTLQTSYVSENWRIRLSVAENINHFSDMFDEQSVNEILYPIIFKLLEDFVTEVRNGIIDKIGIVINILSKMNLHEELILRLLESCHASWKQRLLYPRICFSVAKVLEPEIFLSRFLPPMIELANDRVPNVRVSLAKNLTLMKENNLYLDEISPTIEKLKLDSDRDVIFCAGGDPPPYEAKKSHRDRTSQ